MRQLSLSIALVTCLLFTGCWWPYDPQPPHSNYTAIGWVPDGSQIVTLMQMYPDNVKVEYWSPTGQKLSDRVIPGYWGSGNTLQFYRDKDHVVRSSNGSGDGVQVMDLRDGSTKYVLDNSTLLSISPSGKTMLVNQRVGNYYGPYSYFGVYSLSDSVPRLIYQYRTDQTISTNTNYYYTPGPGFMASDLLWSLDLYDTLNTPHATLFDTTGRIVLSSNVGPTLGAVAAPDGKHVWLFDGDPHFLDLATGKDSIIYTFGSTRALRAASDGSIFTLSGYDSLYAFNTVTLGRSSVPFRDMYLESLSPDGKHFAFLQGSDSTQTPQILAINP